MVDLKNIEHIYLFPGITDMRLGIYGLRKLIIKTMGLESNTLYIFCSKNKNQLKIIESSDSSIWLYQNKLIHGKFMRPNVGEKSELTKDQLRYIIEGAGLVGAIENRGKKTSFY